MNTQSENINELFTALSKAQGELKNADKRSVNPHYKSKYADLSEFIDASREPLSKYNLAVTQTMGKDDQGTLSLFTTLGHSSGQWIRSSFPLICKDDKNIQSWGSSITYIRRYCLGAIIGIAPDEPDDDGQKAISPPEKKKQILQPRVDHIVDNNEMIDNTPKEEFVKYVSKSQIKMFNEKYDQISSPSSPHYDKNTTDMIDQAVDNLKIEGFPSIEKMLEKDWMNFMKAFDKYFEKRKIA